MSTLFSILLFVPLLVPTYSDKLKKSETISSKITMTKQKTLPIEGIQHTPDCLDVPTPNTFRMYNRRG